MLHCVFSVTNQKITESYTIWRHEVGAEWPKVTPGRNFRKLVLEKIAPRLWQQIHRNEAQTGAGLSRDGSVHRWRSQREARVFHTMVYLLLLTPLSFMNSHFSNSKSVLSGVCQEEAWGSMYLLVLFLSIFRDFLQNCLTVSFHK